MNTEAFRHFYAYHFAENRKVWDYAMQLSHEQFAQSTGYSYGSVREQMLHLMSAEEVWFCELRGVPASEAAPPADFDDREMIRAKWDGIEQDIRDYLADLRDEQLFEKPIKDPEEDQGLSVWQVLLHVANHGTDHRAQVLRFLNDLGVKTGPQDYIFYAYDHP